MAKRKRVTTAISIAQKGRGSGRGSDYDPALHIQDVPSKGRATRCKGWKTGRIHHLMSKLEWLFFLILEWSLIVIDIREQYPLDLDETLAIAESLHIKHPISSKTKKPFPITTDFLITTKTPIGTIELARTVKYSKDLSSTRTLEKFEIERMYWERRKIDWGIVTERDIDLILAANVEMLHNYRNTASLSPLTPQMIYQVKTLLTRRVVTETVPLRIITKECDAQFNLTEGTCSKVVLHLLASRQWQVNMHIPIQLTKPIILLQPHASIE